MPKEAPHEHSPVAQLAEQVAVNHRVGSSNLSRGARIPRALHAKGLFLCHIAINAREGFSRHPARTNPTRRSDQAKNHTTPK